MRVIIVELKRLLLLGTSHLRTAITKYVRANKQQ